MSEPLSRRAAIAGIGATEFSKESGRSELQLAVEAVQAALDDAGLEPTDVDGLTTYTMDTSPETEVAKNVGMGELSFFSRIHYGGGAACATVHHAAMAVATGIADVAVAYRAFNERSGRRYGTGAYKMPGGATAEPVNYAWYIPFGLMTPASWAAMLARRSMHEYGATSEDFGRVAVTMREHAANNPDAWFHEQPITLDDHQRSRWIVEPLHLLDCCQESDGGVALVITSTERARDLPHPPAVIEAAAQGAADGQELFLTSYYDDEVARLPEVRHVGRQLYDQSGLTPEHIRTATIYDHFTPLVLTQLEELGFCGEGEGKDFVADGHIGLDGRLPINTNGGQLGEAYIHGMNGISEAVRQVRGTSVNQVDEVEHVLVTAGSGVPTSGLILGRDDG